MTADGCHPDWHELGVHEPTPAATSTAHPGQVGERVAAGVSSGSVPGALQASGTDRIFAALTRAQWLLLGLWFGVPLALCAGWAWSVAHR